MIPTCLGLLGALVPAWSAPALPQEAAPPLHDHASIVSTVQTLAGAHEGRLAVEVIATSPGGLDVHALRVSAASEIPESQPAILLLAGLDGARAYTTSMALDHVRALLEGYGTDDGVTQLLDTTTVYVVPRLDVDAAQARFARPRHELGGTGHGVDNDRDGRQGEDPPADIDGDGLVTWIRYEDPEGEWIEDPTDPRAMVKADAKKGQRGKWKRVTEGFDSDGDERVAEDPLLDAVVNRNFARNWDEHAAYAGLYPTNEPATFGLSEFLLAHPDIALVVTYGDEHNLGEKPKSQPDSGPRSRGEVQVGIYEKDMGAYGMLGERYRELTGNEAKPQGEQPGSAQGFLYHHRGLFTLDIDPWAVPLDAKEAAEEGEEGTEEAPAEEGEESTEEAPAQDDGEDAAATDDAETPEEEKKKDEPKPGDEAKRLIWLDQNTEAAFVTWTAFEHPQLGPVEIGGFAPYVLVEPPAEQLAETTVKHFEFLLTLGADLPRLALVDVEAKALGGGLFEVSATLENPSLLPQQSRAAERSRAIRPARVHIQLPEGAELLGGRPQQLVGNLAGVGGREEFLWLVGGVGDIAQLQVTFHTDNAGAQSATPEVK